MKTLLGIVLIILGVVLGLYVGGYLCFVMGIVNVITGVVALAQGAAVNTIALSIAFGILKIMFAGFIGVVTFWICVLIGGILLK
jgi:uncharacterized membrane protein